MRSSSPRRPRGFADWAALAEAWWCLLAVDLCLRLFPYPRVERLFGRAPREGSRPAGASGVARCVWAAGAASRHHLWPMRCLARSLCLRRLLARRGIGATLRIGVAREGDRLLAHAWIEWEGRPLGEGESIARFEPLLGAEEADRAASLLSRGSERAAR
ncbi:MAG TPA: lasso peptide biosynthesis B2 protein [Thermoanaerobaculia bacterium]|nr:lasso peptide biosynthesis B2 protein [Thermoanaerobaculia bacterium]